MFEDGAEYVITYAHDDVRTYTNEKLVKFGEEDGNLGIYNSNELWEDQIWTFHKEDGGWSLENKKWRQHRLAKWGRGDEEMGTYSKGKYDDQIWNIEGSEYDGYVISNKVWSNHNLTKLGNGDKDIGTVYNGRGRWNITPVLSIKEVTWNKLLAIDNSMGYKDIERELSYRVGYKSNNPAHASITTKREMSSVVKSLYLGGSMEASVGHSSTSDRETHVELKQTFTIPRRTNFWICQRIVDLKVFNTDDTVRIWDSELIVNGSECEGCYC